MATETRLIRVDDADALTELLIANREFLAPMSPVSPDDFYTIDAQRDWIGKALEGAANGEYYPFVILDSGRLIGRITLSNVIRHNLLSCTIGYWVDERHNGSGHATAAVEQLCRYAFDELGLHRVEAGTLIGNLPSQRVLAKAGFVQYGLAPKFLKIADFWQDHVLFQRLSDQE